MMAPSFLPGSLCDTWTLNTVSHFEEADAADAKLLIDRAWPTAAGAACVTANLELRLASSSNLE